MKKSPIRVAVTGAAGNIGYGVFADKEPSFPDQASVIAANGLCGLRVGDSCSPFATVPRSAAPPGEININYALLLALTFILGAWLGSRWSLKINASIVRLIFAVFMVLAAIRMAIKSITELSEPMS